MPNVASNGPETIVVTGADENYFVLACLLMQSLKRFAPRFPFYVLDFGLNGAQRRFLAGRGMLIDMPASVKRGSHPFVCKTALGDYLRAVSWLEVVWLDSDTIAVRALDDDLQALVADLKRDGIEVAICQDSVQTVANLFAGGWQMQPFADALRAEGIGLDARYFNTGVLSVARRSCWRDGAGWPPICRSTPVSIRTSSTCCFTTAR